MRIWIRMIVLAGVIAAWMAPAFGEYYQYRDENGVLRFTDDISTVPPEQRPEVTTHQSVVSKSAPQAATEEVSAQTASSDAQPQRSTQPAGETWESKRSHQAEDLDRMQAELKQTFERLQAERTALEAKAPPANAPYKERASYNIDIETLNSKIADYEAKLDAFNQKLNEYNAQVRK